MPGVWQKQAAACPASRPSMQPKRIHPPALAARPAAVAPAFSALRSPACLPRLKASVPVTLCCSKAGWAGV
jgi:hypothetical protein